MRPARRNINSPLLRVGGCGRFDWGYDVGGSMVYAYYRRLSRSQKAVYRKSDEVGAVRLPDPRSLRPLAQALAAALAQDNQPRAQALCQQLADAITARLKVAPVSIAVLAVRPQGDWGELHGCYRPGSAGEGARIMLWMRTAQRRRAVAFRTFLRTLLHELCHHLDYTLLMLPDSFHTQGFYRRESSLFRQLVPVAAGITPVAPG